MYKLAQNFTFHYRLQHKIVRDLKLVTEYVGDVVIEGTGFLDLQASAPSLIDSCSVDIDFVKWNGTDIKPVLEVLGNMEDMEQAAVRYAAGLFKMEQRQAA